MAAEETQAQAMHAATIVGSTLRGTYYIREALDQGGMGLVFIAEHLRLKRKFAVKILARHLNADQHALARFHHEAEIISQLNHPNIVQVVDFDTTDDGEPYLVMELLGGESLETRLERERRLPLDEAVRITTQAASGLTAAHQANIVHRDLKPGNIFLMQVPGEGCFVKLLDFGISKRAGTARGLTGEFDILGTPDYMAPEQASGKTALVDQRGDQFALAVLCYQMMTGALPFAGVNVMEILQRVLNDAPCAPSVINETLPKAIDEVLAKALSKEPTDRFRDIAAFAQALSLASGRTVNGSANGNGGVHAMEEQTTGIRLSTGVRAPTVAMREPSGSLGDRLTPTNITGTHSKRGKMISSATAESVGDLLEQAREALDEGATERAVNLAENALALVDASGDTLARRSVDGSETLLARIYEERIGGLEQTVEINLAASRGATLSPQQAFMLSRLEGGITFEEALDLAPVPRPQALRQLVQLLSAGLIEAC